MSIKAYKSKLRSQQGTIDHLPITNQCVYKGKEAARAQVKLKSFYNINPEYNGDENCSNDGFDDTSRNHPVEQ